MNPRAIEIALQVLNSPNASKETVEYANEVLSTFLNRSLEKEAKENPHIKQPI